MLQVQFQNIKSNDLAQFKDISIQVVVAPTESNPNPSATR
jgi:hypothetical protein